MHLRPPPSPKFLSHFIPSRIVSPLDFSATYGFGKSSSQASSSWVLLNPEYRRLVFFKLNAREMPNRALRAAPPIWEYITLQYASNVLNLASPSQGTRSHYEKLLHERHLTIGHNQCNGARANESRTQLLMCTLRCSADLRSENTYDHVFCLCPHPLLVCSRTPGLGCGGSGAVLYGLGP